MSIQIIKTALAAALKLLKQRELQQARAAIDQARQRCFEADWAGRRATTREISLAIVQARQKQHEILQALDRVTENCSPFEKKYLVDAFAGEMDRLIATLRVSKKACMFAKR